MRDAIKNVLPDVTHRLCGWHLQRNACENIKNPNFLRDFKDLIYYYNDCRDFDRRWVAILDKHNLVRNTWMEKTYKTRAMWSYCFLRDKFFRGVVLLVFFFSSVVDDETSFSLAAASLFIFFNSTSMASISPSPFIIRFDVKSF
ncbi:hypothetical protein AHAS_Ahas13G0249200 [Arachis hypogaea]